MAKIAGWGSKVLGDLIDEGIISIQTGPFGTVLSASEFVKYGIPIVAVREIREGFIQIFDETPRVSIETYNRLTKFNLNDNDLVFARKGNVERSSLIPSTQCKYFLGSDGIRLRVITKNLLPEFLFYAIQSNTVKSFLLQNAYGTTMAGLNERILSSIPLSLPVSVEEQTAIAEALSNVDSLITSLQKLIEKKKAIKQGAMQELLTGKKRLPGFRGEWGEINFAENAKLKARIGWQGLTTEEYLQSGYAYLVTGTDFCEGKIKWNSCNFVSKERYYTDFNIQIKDHDILITKDGTIGKVAYISNVSLPTTLNSGVFVVRPAKEGAFLPAFAYHVLSSFLFDSFLSKLSAGSTINHLYQKDFASFTFKAPAELAEQQAIAQVLSDMDSEIEQLEKKLAKYQQIKQGMMQELLTGRIRLVGEESHTQPKAQAVQEKKPQPAHNQHFDDAVMIAGIVNAFYSAKYPLGRKKVQKLLYLVRRKEQADTSAFHKKAAGSYADEVRYKGGEPIARKNQYIQVKRSDKGSCFERGVQMQKALAYLQDWDKQADIDWLVSQFQYAKVNGLELLATVDMAICDLRSDDKEVSVSAIKDLIGSNKEWRDKLKKDYFKDTDIQRAIERCKKLFPDKEG